VTCGYFSVSATCSWARPCSAISLPIVMAGRCGGNTTGNSQSSSYRVSVVYIATNESNSLLGIANRYQQARDATGVGRWLDPTLHETAYDGVPETAHLLESQAYVDDIYVVNRDGQVLYENHRRADGTMERTPPGARDAIIAERNRPPTPEERDRFMRTADHLLRGRDPSLPRLEPVVRYTVDEAVDLEQARPQPQPDQRQFQPDGRIDHRLADGQNAQRAAGTGVAAPQQIGRPDGAPVPRGEAILSQSGRSAPTRSDHSPER
jgi:hypothetical protein